MVSNDFDIDVKVKCLEERVTQAQLAEMVGGGGKRPHSAELRPGSSLRRLIGGLCLPS